MAESLHRLDITQSPLWASTILPRILEKRAQQISVPPVPPVKPEGQAYRAQAAKAVPTLMNYVAKTPAAQTTVANVATSIAGGASPRSALQANKAPIAQHVTNAITSNNPMAEQMVREYGTSQSDGTIGDRATRFAARSAANLNQSDNQVRANPWTTLGKSVARFNPLTPAVRAYQGYDKANPWTSVAKGYLRGGVEAATAPLKTLGMGVSAATGAGQALLNRGVQVGVNRNLDQAINMAPDTAYKAPQALQPMVDAAAPYAASPELLGNQDIQRNVQQVVAGDKTWRQAAGTPQMLKTIRQVGPQIIEQNPGALEASTRNYLKQWSDSKGIDLTGLAPSVSQHVIQNSQQIFNQPGLLESAVAGKSLKDIGKANEPLIDNMTQGYVNNNPAPLRPVVEQGIKQQAQRGSTMGGLGQAGLEIAERVGGQDMRNRAVDAMGKQYIPGLVKSVVQGQAPAGYKPAPKTPATSTASAKPSAWANLLQSIGFENDPNRGFVGSFLNNPKNSGHRWAAGGLGLMALLWLMSRMGRR